MTFLVNSHRIDSHFQTNEDSNRKQNRRKKISKTFVLILAISFAINFLYNIIFWCLFWLQHHWACMGSFMTFLFLATTKNPDMCRSSSGWCRWSPNKSLEKIVSSRGMWGWWFFPSQCCDLWRWWGCVFCWLVLMIHDNLIYIHEMPCFFLTFNPDLYIFHG